MSTVKGVYILLISVSEHIEARIGALGTVFFEKGLYAYVGSAQNNLDKRIERHLLKNKRCFWHIDYLLNNDAVRVLKVFCKKAGKQGECKIAKKISQKSIAIKGFGSSDCKCRSHLFKLKNDQFLTEFMHEVSLRST